MPGRTFSSNSYRYGYNGKEKDGEIKGEGNSYDFGARIYDPRLGRWLAVDKEAAKGASFSPYSYCFNQPLRFVDNDGKWPGVTYIYVEGGLGFGLGYGVYYVEQSGIAYDDVGKTHFTMANFLYVANQNLEEGSTNPQVVIGADAGLSAGVKQDWSSSTFTQSIGKPAVEVGSPVAPDVKGKINAPSVKASLGIGVAVSENSLAVSLGLQAGAKFTTMGTFVRQSVSLSDAESEKVDNSTDIWSPLWIVNNQQAVMDKEGNITGYQATVATKNTKGEIIDTGIKIFSSAQKDKEGNTSSNGVWTSQAYDAGAKKAETED